MPDKTNVVELGLERMAREGAKEAKRLKEHPEEHTPSFGSKVVKIPPVAQVLVVLHRYCRGCKTTFEMPNKNKLVRFEPLKFKQITKPSEWETSYDILPKEMVLRTDVVDNCQFCWKGELKEL